MLQQFHFRVFIKETSNLKRYMQPHNHCSFIYNGQDMKTTQVSTNEWMDREDVVYMWCICVYVYIHAIYVEYYLAMKKNEIYAIAWTDLEGIIFSCSCWVLRLKSYFLLMHSFVYKTPRILLRIWLLFLQISPSICLNRKQGVSILEFFFPLIYNILQIFSIKSTFHF